MSGSAWYREQYDQRLNVLDPEGYEYRGGRYRNSTDQRAYEIAVRFEIEMEKYVEGDVPSRIPTPADAAKRGRWVGSKVARRAE